MCARHPVPSITCGWKKKIYACQNSLQNILSWKKKAALIGNAAPFRHLAEIMTEIDPSRPSRMAAHLTNSFALVSPFVAGMDDASDGGFQDSLGLRDGVIQTGGFIQFRFVQRFLLQKNFRSIATFIAQRIEL